MLAQTPQDTCANIPRISGQRCTSNFQASSWNVGKADIVANTVNALLLAAAIGAISPIWNDSLGWRFAAAGGITLILVFVVAQFIMTRRDASH